MPVNGETAVALAGERGNDESSWALEHRIHLLETLVGLHGKSAPKGRISEAESITVRGQRIVEEIHSAVNSSGTESVRRFIDRYEVNAPLLGAELPLTAQSHPHDDLGYGSGLTAHAKAILVLEAEHDIRNVERQLREIEVLDKRGAAGAGRLAEHEPLQGRLKTLRNGLVPLSTSYANLQDRVESLLRSHDAYVNTISQLFVTWDEALTEAERTVSRIEREREKAS